MDLLPFEVKGLICAFANSYSQDDLSSLGRLNRTWYEVALPLVYDTLKIAFYNREHLLRELAKVSEGPQSRLFKLHTRRLDLVCLDGYRFPAPIKAVSRSGKPSPRLRYTDYAPVASLNTFLGDYLNRVYDEHTQYNRTVFWFYAEKDWEPLVSLISRLGHLTELNYAIKDMFPPALHHAMRQYHPNCRLNIWMHQSFSREIARLGKFRGINSEAEDPFEMETLQSPNLHALSVSHILTKDKFYQDATEQSSHFAETFPFLLAAPNLKHLQFEYSGSSKGDLAKLKAQWEKSAQSVKPIPVASLKSLSFGSMFKAHCPWEDVFMSISNLVDLSRLKSLDISVSRAPSLLRNARSIVPNLERLFINMHLQDRHYDYLEEDDPEMVELIQEFNPLRFLAVRGLRTYSALHRILIHHGDTLKGLIIPSTSDRRKSPDTDIGYKYPALNGQQIIEVTETCPNLKELLLPIKRIGGRPEECNVYRALGKFTQLHTLVLETIYDPRSKPEQHFPWPNDSLVREIFRNAATDVNLVKAMWGLIFSNQPSRLLRNLRVIPIGQAEFAIKGGDNGKFEDGVLRQLGRSFLLTRTPDDSLDAQEIGKFDPKRWQDFLPSLSPHMRPLAFEGAMRLLRSVWPSIEWDDKTFILSGWESFPLQIDPDGEPQTATV
ncbi:uncharacterized protein N7498_001857 [Penicillium cinerascens]|uniref:Uncharacterized protein n=1 Tax=Penicillium cinerascens TaxID=70096 RepID=A0A9W9TBF1_9EURO|nr:uncharacterized protein N7498_001857 [Penicillium cinerascens]KAJ5215450.1 hypothetical protein N7498_001857 [Penicillium cinerascens]